MLDHLAIQCIDADEVGLHFKYDQQFSTDFLL